MAETEEEIKLCQPHSVLMTTPGPPDKRNWDFHLCSPWIVFWVQVLDLTSDDFRSTRALFLDGRYICYSPKATQSNQCIGELCRTQSTVVVWPLREAKRNLHIVSHYRSIYSLTFTHKCKEQLTGNRFRLTCLRVGNSPSLMRKS